MKSLFFNLESRDIAGNMLLVTCVILWLSDCLKGNGHDREHKLSARDRLDDIEKSHAFMSFQFFKYVLFKKTLILEHSSFSI